MLLDCRNYPALNFPPVGTFEVYDALNIDHGDDYLKVVKQFYGRNLGTFAIQSDDFERYVGKKMVVMNLDWRGIGLWVTRMSEVSSEKADDLPTSDLPIATRLFVFCKVWCDRKTLKIKSFKILSENK